MPAEVLVSQCSSDGPSHSHWLCPSKLSLLQEERGGDGERANHAAKNDTNALFFFL